MDDYKMANDNHQARVMNDNFDAKSLNEQNKLQPKYFGRGETDCPSQMHGEKRNVQKMK